MPIIIQSNGETKIKLDEFEELDKILFDTLNKPFTELDELDETFSLEDLLNLTIEFKRKYIVIKRDRDNLEEENHRLINHNNTQEFDSKIEDVVRGNYY